MPNKVLKYHLCLILFSSSIFAEDMELNTLTVVSTRLDNEVTYSPKNVTIINAEQIERSPAKTIPEILSLEAGILSRSTFGNSAVRSTIDIRGFGASSTQNTLILLDGRRLNDVDLSSVNYAAIPIHNIERIEIIRGSGGVLYGDGAVGGVVNIITKRAQAGEKSGVGKASYGSYATSQFEGALRSATENYGLNIAANYIDSSGYRKNNDLRQKNIQADIRREHLGGELFFKGGASDQDLDLPGNRTVDPTIGLDELSADRKGTNTPNDFASEETQYITIGVKQKFRNGINTILDVGYRYKNQKSFLEQGGFPNSLDTDLDVWSFTPRFDLESKIFSMNHNIRFGADIYNYNYDSDTAPTFATINTPVHRIGLDQESYAVYANDLIGLTNSTYLEFGVRLQHVSLDAKDLFDPTAPGGGFDTGANDISKNDTEEMYNLGLRQFFTNEFSIYGNVGRSVRFGTIDEIYQFNALFVREFSVIEPQTSEHADIGIDYKTEKLSGSVNAYYMDLENEIHFNPITFTNQNLDATERKGIETTIELRPVSDLSIIGNYAYIDSKFDDGPFAGNEVPLVPKHTASLSAIWDINSIFTFSTTWRYVGEKRFDNDQTNDFGQKIPDYNMLDLKLSGDYQGWNSSFSINNILEEEAFDFGVRSTAVAGRYNGQPLPERNFTISIGYNFN
jgi:iron complex outermembrane recepter protein